jgi:hypothetical protein
LYYILFICLLFVRFASMDACEGVLLIDDQQTIKMRPFLDFVHNRTRARSEVEAAWYGGSGNGTAADGKSDSSVVNTRFSPTNCYTSSVPPQSSSSSSSLSSASSPSLPLALRTVPRWPDYLVLYDRDMRVLVDGLLSDSDTRAVAGDVSGVAAGPGGDGDGDGGNGGGGGGGGTGRRREEEEVVRNEGWNNGSAARCKEEEGRENENGSAYTAHTTLASFRFTQAPPVGTAYVTVTVGGAPGDVGAGGKTGAASSFVYVEEKRFTNYLLYKTWALKREDDVVFLRKREKKGGG